MKSNPSIYEINTRVWIKRFGTATLSEIPDQYWLDLKNNGIDYINWDEPWVYPTP